MGTSEGGKGGTDESDVRVNRLDPTVGPRYEQLRVHKLFHSEYNPVLCPDTERSPTDRKGRADESVDRVRSASSVEMVSSHSLLQL